MTYVIMPGMTQMLSEKDSIIRRVKELSGKNDFQLLPVCTDNWNDDLSPWPFSDEKNSFGGRADLFLKKIMSAAESLETADKDKIILAGYSLAGLFALWASSRIDAFHGVVSCSGSLWFPGFCESKIRPNCKEIYLSLGDSENRTKNPLMKKVRTITEKYADDLRKSNNYESVVLEMNSGNHFADFAERMAKGIARLI